MQPLNECRMMKGHIGLAQQYQNPHSWGSGRPLVVQTARTMDFTIQDLYGADPNLVLCSSHGSAESFIVNLAAPNVP